MKTSEQFHAIWNLIDFIEFQWHNSTFNSGSYESRWSIAKYSRAYYLVGTIAILHRWKRDMVQACTSCNPLEQYDSTYCFKSILLLSAGLPCGYCHVPNADITPLPEEHTIQTFKLMSCWPSLMSFNILPWVAFIWLRRSRETF